MARQETNVSNLVDMINRGELRLPEMQRRYVWTSARVRDLLDSLYRGYPSGTILVWETDSENPVRNLQVQQDVTPFSTHKLLLDGQQRLTSLSAVIRGVPIQVKNRQRPIDIAFNLDHPDGPSVDLGEVEDEGSIEEDEDGSDDKDEESLDGDNVLDRVNKRIFSVASNQLLSRPSWVRVSDVFKGEKTDWAILKPLVDSPDDPRYEKYSQRLQKLKSIKNYPYVMEILPRELSYEEVAQIFVRVNSLGAKLRGSDLAMAQITAKWAGSLTIFEGYASHCEDSSNFLIDTGLLVRLIVVFATKQSRFRTVSSIPLESLKSNWELAKKSLDFTINFLKTNAGIEALSLLASPYYLIPIAVYGQLKDYNLTSAENGEILEWLYSANARGHYSGSSESKLDADLKLLFDGNDFKSLTSVLAKSFGRLFVEPADFVGRGQRSALFSLAYLALKYSGAKDWNTGLGLSLTHQGHYHFVEFHHIFPKSLLQISGNFESSEINEIANMAFISGRANRSISNKKPEDYLPIIAREKGEEVLIKQAIPFDVHLNTLVNFKEFLDYRRNRLAELVNEFIKVAVQKGKVSDF